MKYCLFAAVCGGLLSFNALRAELPHYRVVKVNDFFPELGPVGDPTFPNYSYPYSLSADGSDFLGVYVDLQHPVSAPGLGYVTPAETNYVIDHQTLMPRYQMSLPLGYVTGTSGAAFTSSAGHIVASSCRIEDRHRADYWNYIEVARTNPDGTTTVLSGGRGIEQRGVNARGDVIGIGVENQLSYKYTDAGGWQLLGDLGNRFGFAEPHGINDSGTVVGETASADDFYRPFIHQDAAGMTEITNGAERLFGRADAINNHGEVAGVANGRGFYFNAETLEFKFITPAFSQQVADINLAGAMVGTFLTPPPVALGWPGGAAWIATKNDGFNLLENLLGDPPTDPKWLVNSVVDINDDGWILGVGYNIADRQSYRILLIPVPEPGTATLLILTGFCAIRRRRSCG